MTDFTASDVLRMSGDSGRRWLITRLRANGIGEEEYFSPPVAADALAVLFLRSKGVKFAEAIQAIRAGQRSQSVSGPAYGGVWSRLMVVSMDRLKRLMPARLLSTAVAALLNDPQDLSNCLVLVTVREGGVPGPVGPAPLQQTEVYQTIWDHPIPTCAVTSPSGEVGFLAEGQSPSMSEFRMRHFLKYEVTGADVVYELYIGTLRRPEVSEIAPATVDFVGRVLDVIFTSYPEFERRVSAMRVETALGPELRTEDDLQLWLAAQLISTVRPGSLVEVIEVPENSTESRILASTQADPWHAAPWDPPKSLEMLSGYSSRVGVPLVVEKVTAPLDTVVESVESEMRHLRTVFPERPSDEPFTAMSLPIGTGQGSPLGSLYVLAPATEPSKVRREVRLLTAFARIIGEMIERQRAAFRCTTECAEIATDDVLHEDAFREELVELLGSPGLSRSGSGARWTTCPGALSFALA